MIEGNIKSTCKKIILLLFVVLCPICFLLGCDEPEPENNPWIIVRQSNDSYMTLNNMLVGHLETTKEVSVKGNIRIHPNNVAEIELWSNDKVPNTFGTNFSFDVYRLYREESIKIGTAQWLENDDFISLDQDAVKGLINVMRKAKNDDKYSPVLILNCNQGVKFYIQFAITAYGFSWTLDHLN